ncbi:MAG: tyrosine--tRNA ligase, partial [Patescibacteria group bacterium]
MKATKEIIEKILERGVEEVIEKSHLEAALKSGKKLIVKFGIDPTSPDLHLGHMVPLRKLRQFQEAGHKIVLIIGDFTATIGDPSGRSEERKPITSTEVKKNLKKYLLLANKVINIKKCKISFNSSWFEKTGIEKIIKLSRASSLQQILRRADFQERMNAGNDISMLELWYPLFQGYDSVRIKADVEIGGTDQKFNLLMGRRVQRYFGISEQDILTVSLIEGTDGTKKMSKSARNYIALDAKPNDM